MSGIRVDASSSGAQQARAIVGMTAIGAGIGAVASRFIGARPVPAAIAFGVLGGLGAGAVVLATKLLSHESDAGTPRPPGPGSAPVEQAREAVLPAPVKATPVGGIGPRPDVPGTTAFDLWDGMGSAFDDSFYVNETADDGGFGFDPRLDSTGFSFEAIPAYIGLGTYTEFTSLPAALAEAELLDGDQAVYRRGEDRWFVMDLGALERNEDGMWTKGDDASALLAESERAGNQPDRDSIHARHGTHRVGDDRYRLEAVDLGGEWYTASAEDELVPARVTGR